MEKSSYVYIVANAPYGTLYVGSTSNLIQRIWQHREGVIDGFTKRHGLKKIGLVRNPCRHHGGWTARKTDQAVEAGLENQSDSGDES